MLACLSFYKVLTKDNGGKRDFWDSICVRYIDININIIFFLFLFGKSIRVISIVIFDFSVGNGEREVYVLWRGVEFRIFYISFWLIMKLSIESVYF